MRTRRIDRADIFAALGIVVSIVAAQPATQLKFEPALTQTVTTQLTSSSTTTWIDNFDSSTLNNRWSWLGEDTTHWSLTAQSGFLRIITTRNSTVGIPKNLLVQSIPVNDFTVQTNVVFKPTQDGHFAGLLIMQDANNFLKLGRTNNSGTDSLVFWLKEQGNWSDAGIPSIQPTQDDYYLQIVCHGTSYSGSVSTNGKDWQSLGTLTINFAPTVVGVLAIDESAKRDEIPADFDFFTLK